MSKFIIGFFIFILTNASFAKPSPFFKIIYTVEKGENFPLIIQKFVTKDSIINKSTPMVKETYSKNPHIKNWRELNEGQRFRLFISKKFFDKNKYKKYKAEQKKKKPKKLSKKQKRSPYSHGVAYTVSQGQFIQSADASKVEFEQNSPLSLGYFLGYRKNRNLSYSGSIYFSYLQTASNNISDDNFEIPPEIGMNAYAKWTPKRSTVSYYGGIDFERFNTFNLQAVVDEDLILIDQTLITFFTLGIEKRIKLKKRRYINVKLSVSTSVLSQTTFADSRFESEQSFEGLKSIFFVDYPLSKRWGINSFLKIHRMSGPSELELNRIGLGIRYNL